MGGPRVDGPGLITPDQRPYNEYSAVLGLAQDRRLGRCLEVSSGPRADEMQGSSRRRHDLNRDRPAPPLSWAALADIATRRAKAGAGGLFCVISVADVTGAPGWLETTILEEEHLIACQNQRRVAGLSGARVLGRRGPSPLGLRYELLELAPEDVLRVSQIPPAECVMMP